MSQCTGEEEVEQEVEEQEVEQVVEQEVEEQVVEEEVEQEVEEQVVEEEVEDEVIDFVSLERELWCAVQEEQKVQRENSAKLRAVSQRLATYQEFRDIVLSCHLKPLDQKERRGTGRHTWNPLVSPSNHSPSVP
ncbi:unnamed protein product [Lota lota]